MTKDLIADIIPPNTYQYREHFNNEQLINQLGNDEKKQLENVLLAMLSDQIEKNKGVDVLIVKTLAYLKSRKSLDVMTRLLNDLTGGDSIKKIVIAASIYTIDPTIDIVETVIDAFSQLKDNTYKIIAAFSSLSKINEPEVKALLKSYAKHKDYLVSYNAKRALQEMNS